MQQRFLTRHQLEMLWFMVGALKSQGTKVIAKGHLERTLFGLVCPATVTTMSGLAKAT